MHEAVAHLPGGHSLLCQVAISGDEFPRILLLRGWVNKGIKKGRSSYRRSPCPLAPVVYLARTFQLRLAGVESVLPAASVAFTSKVWVPLARLLRPSGEVHAAKAPPSSFALEGRAAVVEEGERSVPTLPFPEGPETMVVSGGVVSVGGGAEPPLSSRRFRGCSQPTIVSPFRTLPTISTLKRSGLSDRPLSVARIATRWR